jgi:hypothetical protein
MLTVDSSDSRILDIAPKKEIAGITERSWLSARCAARQTSRSFSSDSEGQVDRAISLLTTGSKATSSAGFRGESNDSPISTSKACARRL